MTQIDPNIALGVRQFQPRDPLESYGNVLAIQGAQQQNALRKQQLDAYVSDRNEQIGFKNALRSGAEQGLRDDALEQSLLKQGYVNQADALRKSRIDAQKIQAQVNKDLSSADKDKQAVETQRGEEVAFFLRNANPENWPILRGYLLRNSKDAETRRQVENMVPEQFDATIRDAMLDRTVKQLDYYKASIDKRSAYVKEANEPVMIDQQGRMVPNQVAISAKSQIAQAGAPVTYGSPVPVQLPSGQVGLVQPPNRAGAQPQIVTIPDSTGARVPVGPAKQSSLPEAAQKQLAGAQNLGQAISDYKEELSNWNRLNMADPAKRAIMGSKYNDMMLQAKEAYNLGVLNGPDYEILQKVVADPTRVQSIIYSSNDLKAQADNLAKVAGRVESTVRRNHPGVQIPDEKKQIPAASKGGFRIIGVE